MASTSSSEHLYAPQSPPPFPLRSAMKHSFSRTTSPSRPSTPLVSPNPSQYISLPPSSGSASPNPPVTPLPAPAFTSSVTTVSPAPSSTATFSLPPDTPHTSPPHLSPSSTATSFYTPKVSFDTFENPAASMFSFTLQGKSAGYRRTRNTRVFLCAASPDESGSGALEWALESLVQEGDELIVCRGVDEEVLERDHDAVREEARELMRQIQEKSVEYDPDRKLSLILEYVPGRITDTLDRLIALYRPDSVVVGTRGRRAWQGMGMSMGIGMGSVSKYCLTHSPVPIIVVRPERKLRKAVEKRRADPKRGTHFESLVEGIELMSERRVG